MAASEPVWGWMRGRHERSAVIDGSKYSWGATDAVDTVDGASTERSNEASGERRRAPGMAADRLPNRFSKNTRAAGSHRARRCRTGESVCSFPPSGQPGRMCGSRRPAAAVERFPAPGCTRLRAARTRYGLPVDTSCDPVPGATNEDAEDGRLSVKRRGRGAPCRNPGPENIAVDGHNPSRVRRSSGILPAFVRPVRTPAARYVTKASRSNGFRTAREEEITASIGAPGTGPVRV